MLKKKFHNKHGVLLCWLFLFSQLTVISPRAQQTSSVLYKSEGRLTYVSDDEGNRIPDFSHAGYRGGGVELPYYPVRVSVRPQPGDDTERINGAISYVEGLQKDKEGVRGAVLLQPGTYQISGQLKIKKSGVVLRGSGSGSKPENATILQVSKSFRGTVVQIGNEESDWLYDYRSHRTTVTTKFLPVGSRNFEVEDAGPFEVGDNIILRHHSSQKWLDAINGGGTSTDPVWEKGYIEIYYNRVITGIKDSTIAIDAPIFNHLDRSLAETEVYRPSRENLVHESGVEYLRIIIQTDGERSENHAENGILFTGVENGWARYVNVFHFKYTGFGTLNSKNITIANCGAHEPHINQTRKRGYNFSTQNFSNNILFKDVNSTNGRLSFVSNGTSVASGIVFLNAHSDGALNSSEGHQKWSQGLLYDNVTFKNPQTYFVLGLYNRGDLGSSHGWGAVHSVAWNVDAGGQKIIVQKPPTAQNYAIGNKGIVTGDGIYDHPAGYIEGTGSEPTPKSLYKAQLSERLTYGVPPDAPAKLTVSSETNNQLNLHWHHSSVRETRFIIERSADGGQTFQTIDTVHDSNSAYTDKRMGQKMYHYRVRAEDANGKSAYSNVAAGEPVYTADHIGDFKLLSPEDQSTFSLDSDPEQRLNFDWEQAQTSKDVEYLWILDKIDGDFSQPIAERSAGNQTELSVSYIEIINFLYENDISFDTGLEMKWSVKAIAGTLQKQASESFAISFETKSGTEPSDGPGVETELSQNYPNPFNPSTTIRFFLSEQSNVLLEIFDLAGTRVAIVDSGMKQKGYHTVTFDGSDLASGVYMYRLKTKNLEATRKMILIK